MPGSGSAAPKATRNNLSEKQRHRLVEHLLKGSKNGKLARGDLKKAAADFSCSYEQEDGADVNLRNGRFGHSGRRGVDVEKGNEALKTIPMKNRTTMRALASELGMARTTLRRHPLIRLFHLIIVCFKIRLIFWSFQIRLIFRDRLVQTTLKRISRPSTDYPVL